MGRLDHVVDVSDGAGRRTGTNQQLVLGHDPLDLARELHLRLGKHDAYPGVGDHLDHLLQKVAPGQRIEHRYRPVEQEQTGTLGQRHLCLLPARELPYLSMEGETQPLDA